MIEVRHLKTLVAIRDTGSLVDAAQQLYLTQSALSHQLKELESRLNCALLVRKSKPIRFTLAGQRLLNLADSLLPTLRTAERELLGMAGGKAGRLHMAIECHSCFQWLIPTLEQFREHWPEVEIDFASGFNFTALPALAKGDLDLVITSDPQPISGLVYEPLFQYQAMLVIAKQHALARKAYIEPQDLADQVLIVYPVERERLAIFTQFLAPQGVEPLKIRTTELTLMMIQLVASGRGVACLPNWALTEYLEKGYVIAKPLGVAGLSNILYAAVREEQRALSYMHEFLQLARQIPLCTLTGVAAIQPPVGK